MQKRPLLSISLLLSSLIVSGCGEAKNKLQAFLDCMSETSNNNSTSGPILAQVGDTQIREADLREYVNNIPGSQKIMSTPEGQRRLLSALIDQHLMAIAARQRGVQRSERFRLRLHAMKMTLLWQALAEAIPEATEAEIQDYFNRHHIDFTPPVHSMASHLLFPTLQQAKKAEKLLRSGQSSGVWKPLPPEVTATPDYAAALSTLRTGQLSEIRKTAKGFEILRKDRDPATQPVDLKKIEPQIRASLEGQKMAEIIEQTRKTVKVTINQTALPSTPPRENP